MKNENQLILSVICFTLVSVTTPRPNVQRLDIDMKSTMFLIEKGYMSSLKTQIGEIQAQNSIIDAIKHMQRFAGIPETGVLDAATKELIVKPRCGMPDVKENANNRVKRYAPQGTKWKKNKLTWAVENESNDRIPHNEVRDVMRRSFEKWRSVTNMDFQEISFNKNQHADIRISFETGLHNDRYAFDGRGGTLAHAFYPLGNTGLAGDCHFDDDEIYTHLDTKDSSKKKLLWVAVHELGHSLGLEHSDVKGAIMYPWYQHFDGADFDLTDDDVKGIQSIYGVRDLPNTPKPVTKPPFTDKPDLGPGCATEVGAIFLGNDRRSYMFNKDKLYILHRSNEGIEEGPYLVSSKFEYLQTVDATFRRPHDKLLVFFHGDTFSVYNGYQRYWSSRKITDGFQKLEKGFKDVDTALVVNRKVYLFKGERYWRFSQLDTRDYTMDEGYPKDIKTNWKGLPSSVDAAFTWSNDKVYFFKGGSYYRFNTRRFHVEYGYPQKLSNSFLKCEASVAKLHDARSSGSSSHQISLLTSLVVLLTVVFSR